MASRSIRLTTLDLPRDGNLPTALFAVLAHAVARPTLFLHVANDRRGFRHDVVDEKNSGAEFVALDAREDFGDDALVVDGALGVYGSLGAHTDWCSLSLWLAPVVWCAPHYAGRSGGALQFHGSREKVATVYRG